MDRLSLANSEFEGHNNAYLLAGDGELALVDTGVATPAVESELEAHLADRGYTFADVETILLTHYHPDHAGLAGAIQADSEATVYAHEADAPLVAGGVDAWEALEDRRRKALDAWGTPSVARDELLAFLEGARGIAGESVDVTPITDGETLTVAGYDLETVHTPGHTAGHTAFEIRERPDEGNGGADQEAFVGDAVLPEYTPNVGGADVRVERPLETYLETLHRIVERGYDRVWPGHREPIDDPAGRARTIHDHHRERTANVIAVLADHGPADPWTVSAHLFGELEGIHVLHGPGEAFAHLDHLARRGVAARENGQYRLTEPSVDLDRVLPALPTGARDDGESARGDRGR